jgi:transcriptional regulator with PAS, ATPase and Fis domain
VISATNRDLATEVRESRFREDHFYRVSIFTILVPPLRERREDIPRLVSHLLKHIENRIGKSVASVKNEVLDRLVHYAWPGNVRELENELERAVALTTKGKPIVLDCLSERVLKASHGEAETSMGESHHIVSGLVLRGGSLRAAREAFEKEFISEVLNRHSGNATRAAVELGMSRQMLQRKIRIWNLREPRPAPLSSAR